MTLEEQPEISQYERDYYIQKYSTRTEGDALKWRVYHVDEPEAINDGVCGWPD